MDRRGDGIVALGFALLGGVVVVLVLNFPHVAVERDPVGPAGLPLLVAAILITGGIGQAYRSLWRGRSLGKRVPPDGPEDEPGHPVVPLRAIGFVVGGLAYVALLVPVGYPLATPLFIAMGLWALRYRNPWRIALIAISFTAVVFYVFSTVLHVPIPTGILTHLLVQLNVINPVR